MKVNQLFEDIQYIKGVGPSRKQQLNRMGVYTSLDLLWHVPREYLDTAGAASQGYLADRAGQRISVQAVVGSCSSRRSGRRMEIVRADLDWQGIPIAAVWFNQPYVKKLLKSGENIFVSGILKYGQAGWEINVADYCIIDNADREIPLMPIYPLTAGLNQKAVRRIINGLLAEQLQYYPEILDESLRSRYGLCGIRDAMYRVHNPESRASAEQARRRLAFEEMMLFKLNLALDSMPAQEGAGICHSPDHELVDSLIARLPFTLTGAQIRASQEIFTDMESSRPMNRLLQGDVGAGKTAVAALAMAKAAGGGYQAAMMAPTEILASQHYQSLLSLFSGLDVNIAWLSGSLNESRKREVLLALNEGNIDILVGTHALIQDRVSFRRLGLVIIDEQHRFGVRQRESLAAKGESLDVLVMTATPIPRTLAISFYGEQNTSWLDELPPGRKMVKTRALPRRLAAQAYDFMAAELKRGHQAYIVCPLIEESEKMDLQNASELHARLVQAYPEIRFALLHGRMPAADKEEIIKAFKEGSIQALVSTTVVEVGVDNPLATLMIVEQAERFGLAQLHQLRGRVGRGEDQSYCILVADPGSAEAWSRLEAMENSNDGFELAMKDLQIRGPGDMMGMKQHGFTGFRILDLGEDLDIIASCDEAVRSQNLEQLRSDPEISRYITGIGRYSAVL